MEKIKYPVGSKIKKASFNEVIIGDKTSGGLIAFIIDKDGNAIDYMTQKQLDDSGFTLVSTPRWIPEKGEIYYFWTDTQWIQEKDWRGEEQDLFRLKQGKVCRTTEECQKKIEEINSREI